MTAQGLREMISANSRAWHLTKDEEAKKRLHASNVALYSELDGLTGSTSRFDEKTGLWSTTQPGAGDYVAAALPETASLAPQVERLYETAKAKELQALEAAHQKSRSALSGQTAEVEALYQEAKNDVAAQHEVARHNLGEWKAESGAASGASDQIALAQNVAAQGELGRLTRQEAAEKSALSNAWREAEEEYAQAVAQAKADGDYALAGALYEEAVRYAGEEKDRALRQEGIAREVFELARENRQQEQKAALEFEKLHYQQTQDAYALAREAEAEAREAEKEAEKRRQAQWELDAKVAQSRASYGDFGGYARLGYSQSEIDSMTRLWRYYQLIR